MSLDQTVAKHYAHGTLETAILEALQKAGKTPDKLTVADLAPVDEFHIGGRQATKELGAQLDLPRGARVLDVGSGLGGQRVGLSGSVVYSHASALALPFPDRTFDGAYMLHVGMNIADKKTAFAEVHRVLKPGGLFAIYDVMRESDGDFTYPVPWSSAPETNFIAPAETYRAELTAAGFTIEQERSRRDFALTAFAQRRAAAGGPPAPGIQIAMGPTAPQKTANMAAMVERGVFAPREIISRA